MNSIKDIFIALVTAKGYGYQRLVSEVGISAKVEAGGVQAIPNPEDFDSDLPLHIELEPDNLKTGRFIYIK